MRVYKRQGSKKWYIDYTDGDGNRIREPVSFCKKEAELVLSQRINAVLQNTHPVLKQKKSHKIKFIDFAEEYIRRYAKPFKTSWYDDLCRMKSLVAFFGDMYLHQIKNYHIAEYRRERGQQKARRKDTLVAPTTINRAIALIRKMMNLASEWYGIDITGLTFPMAKEMQKERILTKQEIRLLIDNSEPPLRHFVLIGLNTGLRKAEILNLRWKQVFLDRGFITLEAHQTKGKRVRRVPLNMSMKELFFKLTLTKGTNKYVFQNPNTGKAYSDFCRSWYNLLRMLGIDDVRFHDLRHTFATYALLNKGGDLVSLQATLGHADISTTARYTKALLEGQQRLVNSFEVPESEDNIIQLPLAANQS